MGGFNSSSPKTLLQKELDSTAREARNPPDELDRITYGIISKVDYETGQVKVKQLQSDGKIGDEISDVFLPLATPLSEIHLLWGALREGLVVRIYCKGKLRSKDAIIEVIGDEDHSFVRKEPLQNEIEIGPFLIFSGGLG